MITRRSWIAISITVLLGIATAVVWFVTRNVHCLDAVGPPQAALRSPHTRAGRPHLVRVQAEDPVSPPPPEERDLQEQQRDHTSPCGIYLDRIETVRGITLACTGASLLATLVSLYRDNEARKRHRRRRRKKKASII